MISAGFIGCGNMGGALSCAVAKNVGGENVYLSDFLKEKAESLSEKLGANVSSNEFIAKNCRYIFIGVKPQVIESTLCSIAPFLKERGDNFTVISMAAGISRASILEMLGFECPVIRIMPNTPCSIGEGMILYSAWDSFGEEEKKEFENLFSYAGEIDALPEKLIDAASAVSGCGPAFCYLFIEALSDGGVLCGLPRDKALKYAAQTLLGASKLVLETSCHPGSLKDAVCSPGGTTIEGVRALEEGGFRASTMNAVIKAYEKTLKLK